MTFPLQEVADQIALVDATVSAMERKWGIGRLRLLVSEATRDRFDQAQEMWAGACREAAKPPHPAPAITRLKDVGSMMQRAWAALDAEAVQVGAAVLVPEWWEVAPDDASSPVLCITRTHQEAHALVALAKAEKRAVEVWTLAEVGRVIRANSLISAIKAGFPGATVTPSSRMRPEAADVERMVFDDIPDFELAGGQGR
jgi:hypothetical protein